MAETFLTSNANCTRKNSFAACSTSTINSSTANNVINAKISTLFFDLDNTLIPTRAGDSKACRKLTEVLENQFAFSKEESTAVTQAFLKAFRRCPDNSQTSLDSWRTYLWRDALPNRYKHLAEQIYAKWLQLRYRYLALPGDYVQMLRRFRESGFVLALITNGPSNAQWEKIKKLNVSPFFDCVLVSSDLPWEKPNPNIFYAACEFLGVKPANCAMIGDKLETDIKGGHLAGLGATFWTPLHTMETDLTDVTHPPHAILRDLLDLCRYFPALNAANNSNSSSNSSTNTLLANSAAHTITAGAGLGVGAATATSNTHIKRRGSQISSSATTSTCESDLHRHQLNYHQQQQQQRNFQQPQHYNKYRRGGSLPAIECLNSDAENSSDSLFN